MFGAALSTKVVFVGDSGVGKTCLIYHLTNQDTIHTKPTVAPDQFEREAVSNSGELVHITFWDTAGQDTYQSLIPSFVRDARAVLYVFDVTDETSFGSIPSWVALVHQTTVPPLQYFIANKMDLEDERLISFADGDACAHEFGGKYFETSAINQTGLEALMADLCEDMSAGANRLGPMDQIVVTPAEAGSNCC
jgi:small GTP-binding protein